MLLLALGCWMLDVGCWCVAGGQSCILPGLAKKVRTDPAPTSGDGRIDLPGTGAAELTIFKSKILSGRYVFSACFRSAELQICGIAELHSAGLRKSLARPDCPQGPGCSADLQSAVSAELHSANLATNFGCLTATR